MKGRDLRRGLRGGLSPLRRGASPLRRRSRAQPLSARLTRPVCPQSMLCRLASSVPCSGVLSILSAMHCNTASGLTALDLTALWLVAAAFRVPLQVSVEMAVLSFSNCCCDVSVSLGSPLSEGAPVRACDACCHLRLMPLSACAPGAPASACSAGGGGCDSGTGFVRLARGNLAL